MLNKIFDLFLYIESEQLKWFKVLKCVCFNSRKY